MNSAQKLFGAAVASFLPVIVVIENEINTKKVTYSYMDSASFDLLLHNDPDEALRIYWFETLGRAHFAATASILRTRDWLNGALSSYENNLFLPFCASFRGLIESSSDSFAALHNVALTIAENNKLIKSAMNKNSNAMVISEELENQLIHFSHARKLEKSEKGKAPSSHVALSAADYVKRMDTFFSISAHSCYSELCQYTHPAADSVLHWHLPGGDDNTYVLFPFGAKEKIEVFCEEHTKIMAPLFYSTLNPALAILKTILHFNVPEFHYLKLNEIDMGEIALWKKCAAALSA
jgi:hypothetical protein